MKYEHVVPTVMSLRLSGDNWIHFSSVEVCLQSQSGRTVFGEGIMDGPTGGTALSRHERATITAFVVHHKRERFLTFMANAKGRRKFLRQLSHFHWFDPRFATPVPWKPDPKLPPWERRLDGLRQLEELLESKGAGKTCWAASEHGDLDGRELEVHAALEAVVGYGMGTILSFIPGKLAYYEGEHERLLLQR